MLSSLADKPFNSKDWVFEIKWDGVRAITLVDSTKQNLYDKITCRGYYHPSLS